VRVSDHSPLASLNMSVAPSTALALWKQQQYDEALLLIKEGIPNRIMALNVLIAETDTTGWDAEKHYVFIQATFLPTIYGFLDVMDKLGDFMHWQEPKADDGHNSGVQTLVTISNTCVAIYKEAQTCITGITETMEIRAKFQRKSLKHPECAEYAHAHQLNETMRNKRTFRHLCCIRGYYVWVHDMIIKNLDVILEPRKAQGGHHMY